MLYINNKKLNITKEEIFVGPFINNGIKGYCIEIQLRFTNEDNVKGYLNLDAGFEKSKDINIFVNREFKGVPFTNGNTFFSFEVFDTENFYDSEIENPINLSLKNIKDNKFEVEFEVNDELIKIKYNGYLNIVEKEFDE